MTTRRTPVPPGCSCHPGSHILKHASLALALALGLLLVCVDAGAAQAGAGYPPGFWSGFGDGLFSLLKFLASPIADVTIFDRDAQSRLYDVGYCLGVLTFTGAAGAAATSTEVEAAQSQLE